MSGAVASPCIDVCRVDTATGWCEGCLRTLDEIGVWSLLDDDEKRVVWRQLAERRVQWRRLHPAEAAPGTQRSGGTAG
ncbi:MAG: DUF1289 domain-containing protein [Rubrivivax sp.]|nr:DUF1289 domain-containing protein [Rubrivivax sp.]